MKKLFGLILLFTLSSAASYAVEDFFTPVPDESEFKSEQNVKLTDLTQLRYRAFENALTETSPSYDEARKIQKLYVLSDDEKSLHRVRIPKAKITQYTNDTYTVKYKNEPDIVYCYNKDGELETVEKVSYRAKNSYYSYHYNTDGMLEQIEVKTDRYHAYIYGLNGLLVKYVFYDSAFDVSGKFLYKKRHIISL